MTNGYYVKLIYFKKSGKFYSSGSYVSNENELFRIWEEVSQMQREGNLPGLVEGARMPLIDVRVPGHPYRHPHLCVDSEMKES